MVKQLECDAIIGCNPAVIPGADYQTLTPIAINRQRRGPLYPWCYKVNTEDPDPISLETFESFCVADKTTKLPEEWPFDSRLQFASVEPVAIFVKEESFRYLSLLPTIRWEEKDGILEYKYQDAKLTITRTVPINPFALGSERFIYWLGDEGQEEKLSIAWSRTLIKDFREKWINRRDSIKDNSPEVMQDMEAKAWRATSFVHSRSDEEREAYKCLLATYLQRYGYDVAHTRFDAGVNVMLRTMTWADFYPKCEELRKQLMGDEN